VAHAVAHDAAVQAALLLAALIMSLPSLAAVLDDDAVAAFAPHVQVHTPPVAGHEVLAAPS
jgi:hypothetical protein